MNDDSLAKDLERRAVQHRQEIAAMDQKREAEQAAASFLLQEAPRSFKSLQAIATARISEVGDQVKNLPPFTEYRGVPGGFGVAQANVVATFTYLSGSMYANVLGDIRVMLDIGLHRDVMFGRAKPKTYAFRPVIRGSQIAWTSANRTMNVDELADFALVQLTEYYLAIQKMAHAARMP